MNEHGKSDRPIVPGEVSEQSQNTGGRRGWREGSGQGESGPAKRDPDSEPGSRAQ